MDNYETRPVIVLQLMSDTFSHGGTPIELLSLVRSMNPAKVHFVFMLFKNTQDNLNVHLVEAGADVIEVNRRYGYDIRLLFDVLRVVRLYDVQIISTHFARGDFYGVLAGLISGIPVIKNVHGIEWHDSKLLRRLDGYLSRYRATIICNSKATLFAFRKRCKSRNGEVVYVGVPEPENKGKIYNRNMQRMMYGLPIDCFLIGYIGGFIELRKHIVLLEALALLLERRSDVYLALIGDGPLRETIIRKAEELGITRHLVILGYCNNASDLLYMCDTYANPTELEGFGIAVVEAMQRRIPVVLADAGSLSELVIDGESGLLFEPGKSVQCASKILRLAEDKEYAHKIAEAGYRRAVTNYSIDRYAKDLEKIYCGNCFKSFSDRNNGLEKRVILHVIPDLFSKGGTPRKLFTLVQNSDPARFKHVFFVFNNQVDSLINEYRQAGASVIEVRLNPLYIVRFVADLLFVIRMFHVNIISTHFPRADFLGLIVGLLSGRAVIKNIHGIMWHPSIILKWLDCTLSEYRKLIICNSNASRNAYNYIRCRSRCCVVYPGVPEPDESIVCVGNIQRRIDYGIPNDAFIITYVGGLIPIREHHIALDALAIISRTCTTAYMMFIGDGPLYEYLEEKAEHLGIRDKVLFLGYRDDVRALLDLSDAYMNPTSIEGFGIAVVEAMQAGIPVILADAGSLPELIEDGKSGVLFQHGSPESLARAIELIKHDREFAKQLGESGRIRAKEMFGVEMFIRKMEAIYFEIN